MRQINELTPVVTPGNLSGAALIPVFQDGATRATSVSAIETYCSAQQSIFSQQSNKVSLCSARMIIATPENRAVLTGVETYLKLNSLLFDNSGLYDSVTGRFVIIRAGYYRINARCSYEANGAASVRRALLVSKISGGVNQGYILGAERTVHANEIPILEASDIVYLNYGDIIRLAVYQDSGTTLYLKVDAGGANQTAMSIEEINPVPLNSIIPLRTDRCVIYGDSQTEGNICGPQNVAGNFLTSNFVNKGVSGITVATIRGTGVASPGSYLAQIQSDASASTNFILAAGVNDLGYAASPVIATIAGYISDIINIAIAAGYKTVTWVVPGAVNYLPYSGNGTAGATINANITLLYNAVALLSIPNIRIVRADLDVILGVNPLDVVWRHDGLHYTRLAQERLASLINVAIG